MDLISRIKRDLKKNEVIEDYTRNDRFIAHDIYKRLKKSKKCYNCKKPFAKEGKFRNIVSHIVPKKYGGGNEEENLKALHKICEKKEDAEKEKIVREIRRKNKDESPEKIMEIVNAEIKSKFSRAWTW